ncbi:MAG: glycoside hydrolase family 127 protein [Lachnospiraceae bacterium]|nr:glycoside hydrolase family 127 protein [Lachnospiraceae bacterium]
MAYVLKDCFSEVELKDGYCVNALNKEISYLLSFDADRLLTGFRETAGLDTKGAKRYGGWENMLIGGHTMGHYLSAMAQAYANKGVSAANKEKIRDIVTYIINELLVCQENSKGKAGFIFGATMVDDDGKRVDGGACGINVEAQFDRVEKGRTNIITESWVPWYTMHKLFAGIIAVYELMGGNSSHDVACTDESGFENYNQNDQNDQNKNRFNNTNTAFSEKTLRLLKGLGDWVWNRASKWSEETRRTVVSIEYGGMNDVLYELYAITGEEKYCLAGDKFDEPFLYDKVASGDKDVLNNHHANTTIPKFIGAMNRYVRVHGKTVDGRLRDETAYLDYARKFWDMVVERHTYVTGGNSEWEHFGPDYILNGERTACNNETCNVYNMLKLSRGLFMLTLDKKYLDYYENAFYNSILSSQNPESGMTTYFQPMATGYFKTYGEPFTKFWCCTGSGMENFTKLSDSLYFYKDSDIYVNMYFNSELILEQQNLKLTVNTDMPFAGRVRIGLESLDGNGSLGDLKLHLRLPDWAVDAEKTAFTLKPAQSSPVFENKFEIKVTKDWAVTGGNFKNGDEVMFDLKMELKAMGLPDDDRVFALKYGPLVLSAGLGSEEMSTTITGVDVTVPARKLGGRDIIVLPEGATREEFVNDPEKYFEMIKPLKPAVDDPSAASGLFAYNTEKGTDGKLVFAPHFLKYRERYGIYFSYLTVDEARKAAKEGSFGDGDTVDTVMPGYGQYENDELHDMKECDTVSVTSGATYRIAKAGGAFSYRMAVEKGRKNRISMMLRLCDNRKPLKVTADGVVLHDAALSYRGTDQYYKFELELPADVVSQAEHVSANGEEYDVIRVAFSGTKDADSAAVCDFVKVLAF